MIVGDLLISGDETENDAELTLPGHIAGVGGVFSKGSMFVPKRMQRKVFVINDKMAAGVSGSAVHMRAFVSDLKTEFAGQTNGTIDGLREFLGRYNADPHGKNVLDNAHALFSIVTPSGTYFLVAGDDAKNSCKQEKSKMFGNVIAIGSGQATLIEEARRMGGYGITRPDGAAVPPPSYSALALNLSLISQLHKIDSLTGRSLLEYWGGGYEVVYYDETKKFRYLDEYTVVYWTIDIAKTDGELTPHGIMRYERRDEHSLIFVHDKGKFEIFGFRDVAAIGPATVSIPKEEIDFNSGLFANAILVVNGDLLLNIYNLVDQHNDSYVGSVFTEINKQGELVILYNTDIRKKLEALIRNRLRNLA